MFSGEAANTNFISFGLIQPEIKSMIYRTHNSIVYRFCLFNRVPLLFEILVGSVRDGLIQSGHHHQKVTCSYHDISKKITHWPLTAITNQLQKRYL
jgi:hypothetical protein